MTASRHQNTSRPAAARPRSMGNVLIIFSIMLIGAALVIAATTGNGVVGTPAETVPENRVAEIAPPRPANIQSSPGLPEVPTTPTAQSGTTREPSEQPASATPSPPPTHIRIPAVEIDTPVVEVGHEVITIDTQEVMEWEVAEYAAGHHNLSANPGEPGNIVVTGHNDWMGEVFRTLEHVELGDEVILTTSGGERRYVIQEIHFRREVGVTLEERLTTGAFLNPMPEERLTLITCWPYQVNDHRIIVVAKPIN